MADHRPPLAENERPLQACQFACGNSFTDPAWREFHERTAHLNRSENDMPGGSDQTFEKAKQDTTDFAAKVAEARRNGRDAS